MNSLVQELAEKAKTQVPQGLSVEKWIETYNERLTELVVRECGKSCTLQGDEDDMFRKFGIKQIGVE